jgi:polysaccharide deacetylase 2 family uncharacterized protein YibQ
VQEPDVHPATPDAADGLGASAPNPDATRRETVLARYPRKLKIAVALAGLVFLVSPLFMRGYLLHRAASRPAVNNRTYVEGEDKRGAISTPADDVNYGSRGKDKASILALNDQDDASIKLTPAPDPLLSEDTEGGTLPRIAEDGREPWQVYARPYNRQDNRPRIAIVVSDMGLSRIPTDAAINRLPRNITLAFDVQSPVTGAWVARARQLGHEVILNVPMEPFDYPRSDPGTHTLLTTLPNVDNIGRLNWALRQATGYVGITTLSGSRFTTNPQKLAPVLGVMKGRGLMVLDARVAPYSAIATLAHEQHVPVAASNARLDQNLSPEAIDTALAQLEQAAQINGGAIGIVAPYPVMLDRLDIWLKGLPQRGVSLAPLSAMVE